MTDDIGQKVHDYRENVQPDPVVAERILHAFSQNVTQEKQTRLLTKRRWFFALFNVSTIFAMLQAQGIKLALAAFLTVATVGGVVAVSNNASHRQPADTKIAEDQVSPAATSVVEITTDADIEIVAKVVDQSVTDLDRIETDLDALDVSLSTQELDKAMKELDDIE